MVAKFVWAFHLLVIVSASARKHPPFPCPQQCNCGPSTEGDLNILCTQDNETLHVDISFGKYVKVDCSIGSSNYDILDGLFVGSVNLVKIQFCPLSDALLQLTEKLNITGVKTLSLGQANLSSISKQHLKNFVNVTQLSLPRGEIVKLPPNLLEDFINLKSLNVVYNQLQTVPVDFFSSVPKLTFLELGANNISQLRPGTFKNLVELKYLNLWGNSLQNLSREVFSGLANLESLDLHQSKITTLDPDLFVDLVKLKQLSLLRNNFSTLPHGLLNTTPHVEVFKLFDNLQKLVVPSGLLANLNNLSTVFLNRNNISTLPNDLFKGSKSIVHIHLEGNALTELSAELFKDTEALKTLDISSNQLTSLPEELFATLTKLEILRMANNQLTTIPQDMFNKLDHLEELNLARNRLVSVDPGAFPMGQNCKIKKVYMAHNRLNFTQNATGSQSPFRSCLKIEELYLANNSIMDIFTDWSLLMLHLRKLDLSSNNISVIRSEDLQFLSSKLTINLSNNKIHLVDMKNIEKQTVSSQSTSPTKEELSVFVLLKGNPINCDCRSYSLLRYMEGKFSKYVYNFVHLVTDNLTCSSPPEVSGVLVSQIKSRTVTCDLTEDPSVDCPKPCACRVRPDDVAFLVDCSGLGLYKAPGQIPSIPLWNYTEVHLERNRLVALPDLSLPGYDRVTKMFASYNNISKLDKTNVSPTLQVLELNGNNLTHVAESTMKVLLRNETQIQRLRLDNNPWRCDCGARGLLGYLQVHFRQMEYLSNVSCSDGRVLSQLSVNDLCPISNAWIIALSASVAIVGIVLGTLAALYYRYQHEVKVWLYAKHLCLWFVTEEELDKEKHYDAFISYSHNDEDFVVNHLVPGLESGPTPFKLCLHFRDWIPGEWITSQIARSVEDSRRTVVVLSPNFVDSVWGRMEFRAAHKQALSDGRARVILLIYGELGPLDSLDPELRTYLSTNTYVKWGDPWFWNKLRYALPHPPQFGKTETICTPPASHVNTAFDDKLELMQPTTPNPTTPPADLIISPLTRINDSLMPLSLLNGINTKLILETNNQVNGCVKSV